MGASGVPSDAGLAFDETLEEVAVEVAWGSGLVAPDIPAADGANGPLSTIMPPPPDSGGELPPPPEPLQIVVEGVMTLVTVPAPEYASEMEECEPVQVLLVTSLVTSDESCWNVGDDTVSEEPEASVTEKLPASTVIDCIAAVEPDTLSV